MSVTIDGPADFPALCRSADRESLRAQRSYLRSLRVRLACSSRHSVAPSH